MKLNTMQFANLIQATYRPAVIKICMNSGTFHYFRFRLFGSIIVVTTFQVHSTLTDLKLAIDGTIVMSQNLRTSLDAMYDARIPEKWLKVREISSIFSEKGKFLPKLLDDRASNWF